MLRIDNVSITNYKNIQVDNLSLDNFNVIVGPNNSGKSNFIQVISFLNHIINGSIDEIKSEFKTGYFYNFGRIDPSYIEKKKGTITISLRFVETELKIQYLYEISLTWKANDKQPYRNSLEISEESFEFKDIHKTGPAIKLFSRNQNSISFAKTMRSVVQVKSIPNTVSVVNLLKVVLNKEYSKKEFNKAIYLLDKILKIETIYFSNLEFSKLGQSRINKHSGRIVSFDLEKEIYKISKSKTKYNFLIEILSKILKIESLDIVPLSAAAKNGKKKENDQEEEYYIFFRHMNDIKTLQELSDGSILIIALITKIISSDSSIFLIEEPENSLHPKALIDLIDFMKSYINEKQFILASHSISIINAVKPENVIISKCNEDGSSIFQRVQNIKELKRKLKDGFITFSDALFFDQDELH